MPSRRLTLGAAITDDVAARRDRQGSHGKPRRGAVLLAALIVSLAACSAPSVAAQPSDEVARATWPSLEDLSPRERVAQLVVVAYYARPEDPDSDVRRLIVESGIGGVVLQKGNGIFQNERGVDLPMQIASLTAELQRQAIEEGPGVPLFIAMDHEGDGNPFTHLREGFTALPSPMAIGATWDIQSAETIGRVAGAELAAVGVNMLLGPGLDVLAEPRVDSGGDIGIRSFGGSPYWVARLGAAYIRGVHEGSRRRVMTVAKHFPGHGGNDRDPDSGVSTVIAPVSALASVDLAPFAAVTTEGPGDPDRPSITDAMMTSHIRYFGLQGNVQDGTPPISFDREGLELLLERGSFGFTSWRELGGLIVSDSLGVPAVRDWFSKGQQSFPNRLISHSALLAGNDVLLLAQFDAVGAWDLQLANIDDTLQYFTLEYQRDPVFRARVDEAAERILAQKQLLYPQVGIEGVAVEAELAAGAVGGDEARDEVAQVTSRAITAWRSADSPPARGDRIMVITPRYRDSRTGRLSADGSPLACHDETCGLSEAEWQRLQGLGPTLVEAMILDEFGPSGLGLVSRSDVDSIAFCQLRQALSPVLASPRPTLEQGGEGDGAPASEVQLASGVCDPTLDSASLIQRLADADWIVFAFSDLDPDESLRLRGLLLPQVQSLARERGARVAVLSFGPPYYIDTTNLAQLHAHYSAYTKIPSAVRAAVRALFGVGDAPGASPVTVKNADYLLAQALEPDPNAQLELSLAGSAEGLELPASVTLVVTGLRDRNGQPVPDGTLVHIDSEPADAIEGGSAELKSAGAEARGEVTIVAGGLVRLRARTASGASERDELRLSLPEPTPEPTSTTASPATAAASATDDTDPDQKAGSEARRPRLSDFFAALLASMLAMIPVVGGPWRSRGPTMQVRGGLWAAACGLAVYVAYASLILRSGSTVPGVPPILDSGGISLVGALIGLALGWRLPMATGATTSPGPPRAEG